MNACYHCQEAVPAHENRWIEIEGDNQPLCCAGCEAVTRLILDAGLDDFYRFRSAPSPRIEASDTARWRGFDETAVMDAYAPQLAGGERELRLQLDDLRCAACGWLVEKTLGQEPGVCSIRLNAVTGRTTLRWRQEDIALSELLAMLDALGFKPHPLRDGEQAPRHERERKAFLKRLGVAGLGMMQVMMYGVAMYIGTLSSSTGDMDAGIQEFLRYVSLLIATPVVFYSGAPFFRGAWRDLRARTAGMDVPVALAIGGAYTASVWHTFAGVGEVYFDSVSMFVFFLLIGRFVEFTARHEVSDTGNALAATLPAIAECMDGNGNTVSVPLTVLRAGDTVRVKTGETVPADGILLDTRASLDEALLSGESDAVSRNVNEHINAGAINRGAPFRTKVTHIGRDTLLSGVTRMLENAQSSRPRMARFADRLARWFVAGVLLAAGVTALAWWQLDAARAFEITLSVLVVTCPCALALAVPVALTAATSTLAKHGLLTVNSDALETLAGITDVVFDKTGTLTLGKPRISRIIVSGDLSEQRCLDLAAGLEAQANHPIAEAFRMHASASLLFAYVEQHAGSGVEGLLDGVRYRIGSPAFATGNPDVVAPEAARGSWIVLARETSDRCDALAWFALQDSLRPEALSVVSTLQQSGLNTHLFSGDASATVDDVAIRLGISSHAARMQPNDKLQRVRELQASGRRVLMIGDGINDSPVLAGADVAIAMSGGAVLAQSSADFVLTGKFAAIPDALQLAKRARHVMRQNLAWALAYNLLALPLAAMGLVEPWMAAIGMSASSVLVTVNALRMKMKNSPQPESVPVQSTPVEVINLMSR